MADQDTPKRQLTPELRAEQELWRATLRDLLLRADRRLDGAAVDAVLDAHMDTYARAFLAHRRALRAYERAVQARFAKNVAPYQDQIDAVESWYEERRGQIRGAAEQLARALSREIGDDMASVASVIDYLLPVPPRAPAAGDTAGGYATVRKAQQIARGLPSSEAFARWIVQVANAVDAEYDAALSPVYEIGNANPPAVPAKVKTTDEQFRQATTGIFHALNLRFDAQRQPLFDFAAVAELSALRAALRNAPSGVEVMLLFLADMNQDFEAFGRVATQAVSGLAGVSSMSFDAEQSAVLAAYYGGRTPRPHCFLYRGDELLGRVDYVRTDRGTRAVLTADSLQAVIEKALAGEIKPGTQSLTRPSDYQTDVTAPNADVEGLGG